MQIEISDKSKTCYDYKEYERRRCKDEGLVNICYNFWSSSWKGLPSLNLPIESTYWSFQSVSHDEVKSS